MLSNLVTPPDIVDNELHSVLLVDPEQEDLDAVIYFCQHTDDAFNVYVYTPNMNNLDWLNQVVPVSNSIIVNSRTNNYKELCLLEKTYYYGDKIFLENPRKITDPMHYFATQLKLNK